MVRKTGDQEPETRSGEGRFARWSRLKREAAAEEKPQSEIQTAARTAGPPPATRDKSDTDRPKDVDDVAKDLPPIESLGKESDYTVFMRDGVPEGQRTAALRKLWRSDPVYNEKAVLDIHMEDFNETFEPINAATDTLFRAGLGYLFDDDKAGKEKTGASETTAVEGSGESPVLAQKKEISAQKEIEIESALRENTPGGAPDEAAKKIVEEQISMSGKKERG